MKKYFIYTLLLCLSIFVFVGCDFGNKQNQNPQTLKITSIEGIKTNFICDEPLPNENSNITIYYNNNKSDTVKMNQITISGFDTSTIGNKTLTIKYNNLSYLKSYVVNYKSIKNNLTLGLPSNFYPDSYVNLGDYKIDVECYNSYKTLPLNDSHVTVTGLNTNNVLNANSVHAYNGSATISCGNLSFVHNYSVWFTKSYDNRMSGTKTIDGYKVEVKNFRVMQTHGLDGQLIIKNSSGQTLATHNLTRWTYGTFLNIYNFDVLLAQYDYSSKILYILSDTFSQIDYDFSVTLS